MAGNQMSDNNLQTDGADVSIDSELVKKVTLRRGQIEAEINNLPSAVVEALYHEITGTKDSISFFLTGVKEIDFSAISDLAIRLQQNTDKYSPISKSLKIQYKLSDGRSINYSSWINFSRFNFETNLTTDSLIIVYDFVIKSNIGTHNHYSITIKLASLLARPVHIEDDALIEWQNRNPNANDNKIKIEFVDTLVARDFYSLILEWNKNLDDHKKAGIYKFVKKYRKYAGYIIFSIWLASTMASSQYIIFSAQNIDDTSHLLNHYTSGYSMILLASLITYLLSQISYNFYDKMGAISYIRLTKGDDREIRAKDKSISRYAFKFVFATAAIGGSIFLNLVSGRLQPIFDAFITKMVQG